MNRLLVTLALAAVTLGRPTHAAAQVTEVRTEERASPGVALVWSLGATLVPLGAGLLLGEETGTLGAGLIVTGILLGPSTGHFYSGEWGRGLAWFGGRSLSVGIMGLGAALTLGDCAGPTEGGCDSETGPIVMVVGLAALGGTAVGGIIDGCLSAGRANRRDVQFVPFMTVGGKAAPGLTLATTF